MCDIHLLNHVPRNETGLNMFSLCFFKNCKELIRSVEDSGTIVREIRDLEDQVTIKLLHYSKVKYQP